MRITRRRAAVPGLPATLGEQAQRDPARGIQLWPVKVHRQGGLRDHDALVGIRHRKPQLAHERRLRGLVVLASLLLPDVVARVAAAGDRVVGLGGLPRRGRDLEVDGSGLHRLGVRCGRGQVARLRRAADPLAVWTLRGEGGGGQREEGGRGGYEGYASHVTGLPERSPLYARRVAPGGFEPPTSPL